MVGRCSGWEQTALCLGVQSYVLETQKWDNHENPEEACRGVLCRWLLHAPGTGDTERTWHSVLEALVTSGHSQLAGQLKREHFAKSSDAGSVSPFKEVVLSVGELFLIPSSLLVTIPVTISVTIITHSRLVCNIPCRGKQEYGVGGMGYIAFSTMVDNTYPICFLWLRHI